MPNFMRPIHFSLLFTITPLVLAMSGCSTTQPKNTTATMPNNPHNIPYPNIDSGLGDR